MRAVLQPLSGVAVPVRATHFLEDILTAFAVIFTAPGGGMRAVLQALSPGVAALAAARRDSPDGAAREQAALECLRLLGAGFAVDVPLVQRLRLAELGTEWKHTGFLLWILHCVGSCDGSACAACFGLRSRLRKARDNIQTVNLQMSSAEKAATTGISIVAHTGAKVPMAVHCLPCMPTRCVAEAAYGPL